MNTYSTAKRFALLVIAANLVFVLAASAQSTSQSAIFAGGCFWCMEPPFDKLEGVTSTVAGYTGGAIPHPNYEQVSAGHTGHYEAVRVEYDPSLVSFAELLDVFWRNIDPLDSGGQFCDRGDQYRSAIFFAGPEQEKQAAQAIERVKEDLKPKGEIATKILPVDTFYAAEDYHQNYYEKNPVRYRFYRFTCGRDSRLTEIWGEE